MVAVVLVAFLVVPLLELYVILQVADVIGGWETIAVLVLESLLGSWLVRREGRRTWRAFSTALEQHRAPAGEVADGALVIVGGTLLLTPGFLSDILGFFVLVPITRPLARRLLLRYASRRMARRLGGGATSGPFGAGSSRARPLGRGLFAAGPFGTTRSGAGRRDPRPGVVGGEVLDERPAADPLRKHPGRGTPPGP